MSVRIHWYALAAAALIALGTAALLLLIPTAQASKNDTVAINDVRYRLAQDFERIRAEGAAALPTAKATETDENAGNAVGEGAKGATDENALAYTVFDMDGRLLASTGEGLAKDINEAIEHRDTIVDIVVGSQTVGKLVLDNNATAELRSWRTRVQVALALILTLLALLLALLLLRVHRNILSPFHRLESFAANVAAGKLDIPLNMDRKNAFGAFTESFDLMRAELAAAREGERQAAQSKKELAAQLSHDIKSPVASIKAISELAQLTETDERNRERMATIEAKADQIDLLISNMFHATLEELQELAVSPVETPSSAVAELIVRADYRHLLDGAANAGAIAVPPCLAMADPIRLEQTLDNVIGNSYKYADTPIAFEAELLDGYLWLNFTDAGGGVSPDELPLLTQKFYRGTNAAEKSGSGLGLYIAHYFMERMGGALTCENTEDGFRVRLALRLA
jgi:signal transduction histidine kinase